MTSLSGATTYTWDPLGHLTSASSATATATYAYGIFGMREQKTVTTASGTKETRSVWDGQRLSAERDSDGTLYRYLHAPDGTPLTLQLTPAGGAPVTYSYHTDAQGSVVALTRDGTGAIAATYAYDAFGRLLSAGGSEPALAERNPLRYRGYYLDAETGLYYLPARYYDPATARFLSPDPAPPQAGDPLSLNAYAYCQGDPVNKWDPDGRRLVAYGGASPVHTEAVKAARSGKLPKARQVQQAYRRALATARAAGMRFDAGREYAAAFVEESEALNVAAGVLAGISAGAATVSAGAALTALATSPAALTGVGAVAPGTALYVAVGAGVVSFATGVGYSVLTKYRVDRGDIPESDIRANAVFDRVSLGSSAAGAGLRVTASTPLTGMVGLGLSWAAIGYELLTY
jgi:RHS repeat-associated protein